MRESKLSCNGNLDQSGLIRQRLAYLLQCSAAASDTIPLSPFLTSWPLPTPLSQLDSCPDPDPDPDLTSSHQISSLLISSLLFSFRLFSSLFITSAPMPALVPNQVPVVADGQAVRWFDINIICRFVLGYVLFVNGSSIIRQLFFFNCKSLCALLYCTVLYCTVLYCTVLYCTVLYWSVLSCTVQLHLTLFHICPVMSCYVTHDQSVTNKSYNDSWLFFSGTVICYLYVTGIGKFVFDLVIKIFLPPERGKRKRRKEKRREE